MRTTKDMDYIYDVNGKEILIEMKQKEIRNYVIEQYVQCRKAKKMTQEQLSQRTGISRPNISRFESGNYNPTLEMMVRIASALEVQLNIQLENKQD